MPLRHAIALCSGQIADADDPGAMAHSLEHTDAIVWNALVLSELIAAEANARDAGPAEVAEGTLVYPKL